MDESETQAAVLQQQAMAMQVDNPGSPTELADDESDLGADPFEVNDEGDKKQKVKLEKRKRERKKQRDDRADNQKALDSEDDLESPSKRASGSDERPLTSTEIRALLLGHVQEMKTAWTSFQGRLDRVELEQNRVSSSLADVHSRTGVLEKDVAHGRVVAQEHSTCLETLTTEVKNMKVKIDELQVNRAPQGGSPLHGHAPPQGGNPDPWGEFLRRKGQQQDTGAKSSRVAASENDKGDLLSEEEKRTLVVGGWAQDTRRSTIEEESSLLFGIPEIKDAFDSQKLVVYGPRRSVGMLKFTLRDGESENGMRERMWQVIRALAQAKPVLPSSRTIGEEKTMWASFVKTRNARVRSSHVSMVRRVTIALAKDAHMQSAGGVWGDLIVCKTSEVSRDAEGWDQFERDEFQWVTHRDRDQWRGVGVGIAKDKFDCVLHKVATKRGIWIVARVLGIGRVVLGSLHCHTGVTNSIYQAAIHEFMSKCPRKYRYLPCICGVDANEVPSWTDDDEGGLAIGEGNANLNLLVQEGLRHGLRALPPDKIFRHAWTHFPRDETRHGRQIDMVLGRQLNVGPVTIAADRRLAIGSDHALLFGDIWVADGSLKSHWSHDSRARWVSRELPDTIIVDEDELIHLAKKFSKPRFSAAFRDDRDTQEAICTARESNMPADWKKVHRMRTQKRKNWKRERLSSILEGDWDLYRQLQSEKRRKRGWWGDMLAERSAEQLTLEIHTHLAEKMKDPRDDFNWDELLDDKIRHIPPSGRFAAFQLHEVCQELQQMRCRSAVGPDQISVHLLRTIVAHEKLGPQLVDLINHIVATQELPSTWHRSFLALLAKIPSPKKPGDLRPICVSSAFNKLVNKLVCTRVLPALRQGSRVSCCGKGRQAADLVGCVSRLRDICREWRHPLLVCKLDVSGAFDRVKRDKVADYLINKLGNKHLDDELRYMLAQLRTHTLQGTAPGGIHLQLQLSPDVGIKQGAPESAEVFGLLVDSLLSDLVHCKRWGELGVIFEGTDLDLLFFQDDIFLLETDLARLCRRIRAVDRCLAQAGLSLAAEKTKIVANPYYTGARRAKVGDEMFVVSARGESLKVLGLNFSLSDGSSEQAREILARTREAAAAHKDILQAPGAWKRKVVKPPLPDPLLRDSLIGLVGAYTGAEKIFTA
ncbi:pol [Symbiodinium sp. KB8]|nr:pol [Symbiodinium sp. KB8]